MRAQFTAAAMAVEHGIQQDLDLFTSLTFLPQSTKEALRPLVHDHARQWRTASMQWVGGVVGACFLFGGCLTLGILLLWPEVVWSVAPARETAALEGGRRWVFSLALVAGAALMALIIGLLPSGNRSDRTLGLPSALSLPRLVLPLGAAGLALLLGPGLDSAWQRVAIPGLALGVATITLLWVACAMLGWWLMMRAVARHADSFVIDRLIYAAWLIDQAPHPWTNLGRKERVASILEEAAVAFQHHVALRLRTGESATDLWLKEESASVAAGLRELKRWVCFPTEATYAQLRRRFASDIPAAITGRWDDITPADPPRLTPAQLRHRAASAGYALLQAVLPLGLLALLQQTPLRLPVETVQNGYLIAFTIGALLLVHRMDPRIAERLTGTAGLLKAIGGKGE